MPVNLSSTQPVEDKNWLTFHHPNVFVAKFPSTQLRKSLDSPLEKVINHAVIFQQCKKSPVTQGVDARMLSVVHVKVEARTIVAWTWTLRHNRKSLTPLTPPPAHLYYHSRSHLALEGFEGLNTRGEVRLLLLVYLCKTKSLLDLMLSPISDRPRAWLSTVKRKQFLHWHGMNRINLFGRLLLSTLFKLI